MTKRYLFDSSATVKRVLYGFYAMCIVLLLADVVVRRHGDHPVEGFFGFYALYGFVACVTLVLVAKVLRNLVMRREDHYGD